MSSFSPAEKLIAARTFVTTWADRGNEKSDTQQFWLDLLENVVGMKDTTTNVLFEAKTSQRGYIDVWIPDAKTFIEQKSINVDLDKADERAYGEHFDADEQKIMAHLFELYNERIGE